MEIREYIAKQDAMFGIVKGDTISFNVKQKLATLIRTGNVLPFDPTKETKFFTLKRNNMYKSGDVVYFQLKTNLTNNNRKIEVITAFANLQVIGSNFVTRKVSKNNETVEIITVIGPSGSTFEIDTIKTPVVFQQTYFFISSRGILQIDNVGRDKKGEEFRKEIGNYHTTSEAALTYLTFLIYNPFIICK